MLIQIMVAALVIPLTVIVHVCFTHFSTKALTRRGQWLAEDPLLPRAILASILLVLWLIFSIVTNTLIWAFSYFSLEIFDSIESALYFSIVSFTTLGYGDITLDKSWRLLASFSSINGVIIIGLNTAYLIEFTYRLNKAHVKS